MKITHDEQARQARYAIRMALARRWVNRRVETFAFLDAETVRRRMSIDMTLSTTRWLTAAETALVPLMMLVKGNLRNLDVIGPDGESLAVLNTAQNAAVAVRGLKEHLVDLLAEVPIASSHKRIDVGALSEIVEARGETTGVAKRHLDSSGALGSVLQLMDPIVCVEIERLIRELERSFLLLVPLEYQPERRVICKVSYDVALATQRAASSAAYVRPRLNRIISSVGLAGRAEVFENLAVGLCESYHAEVVPPKDTYVAESALTVLREGAEVEDPPKRDEHRFRPHVRVSSQARGDTGTLSLIFHAYRQELLLPLVFSGVLISATLGLVPAQVYSLDGQTIAALLLVPFALSAYYVRGQDNSYATHMLIGARLLVLLPLLGALAVLTLLALGSIPPPAGHAIAQSTFDLLQTAFLIAAFPTALLTISLGTPALGRALRPKIRGLESKVGEARNNGGATNRLWRFAAIGTIALALVALLYGFYRGATIWLEIEAPSPPAATISI